MNTDRDKERINTFNQTYTFLKKSHPSSPDHQMFLKSLINAHKYDLIERGFFEKLDLDYLFITRALFEMDQDELFRLILINQFIDNSALNDSLVQSRIIEEFESKFPFLKKL